MGHLKTKLIGISGTNGSGKDSVGNILEADYGFLFISVTDILRRELVSHNMETSRFNMRHLSSQWRKQYGLGVLVDKAQQIYESAGKNYQGLAISSLRNFGEADSVHQHKGIVLWLDADPKIRYQRIQSRGGIRQVDDNKSYEDFLSDEAAEMYRPDLKDKTTLSLAEVKDRADVFLINEFSDFDHLSQALADAINHVA